MLQACHQRCVSVDVCLRLCWFATAVAKHINACCPAAAALLLVRFPICCINALFWACSACSCCSSAAFTSAWVAIVLLVSDERFVLLDDTGGNGSVGLGLGKFFLLTLDFYKSLVLIAAVVDVPLLVLPYRCYDNLFESIFSNRYSYSL